MQAIRFHGRGGQGAKTASRILGTAAFFEGYQAQDSPIYGAERRGAPVAAFTRIAKEPIHERAHRPSRSCCNRRCVAPQRSCRPYAGRNR
jgi:2-oxoacid:acceptor oxidoreductase gamma subunit (pyruvate/2-ketoisovalerate family)